MKHIFAAADFGAASDAVLDAACELADALGAELTVVHVIEPPPFPYPGSPARALRASSERALDAVVASARTRHANTHGCLREGTAWREIVDAAKSLGADLIVLGADTKADRWEPGRVAERVARASPVPVLTVHRTARSHDDREPPTVRSGAAS